jgi:hypothetical protein
MDIRKAVSSNVFLENDSWNFSETDVLKLTPNPPSLCSFSIICREKAWPRDREQMIALCAEHSKPLLFKNIYLADYSILLFVSHTSWLEPTVMNRHKKLWKSFPSKWQLDEFKLKPEIEIISKDGVRYAGNIQIDSSLWSKAIQILFQSTQCILIATERKNVYDSDEIRNIFDCAFPRANDDQVNSINLLNLCLNLCPLGDIIINATESYDHTELAINYIMSPEKLNFFKA